MEFKWDGNPKTETDFLKSYGDSFVYRLVEGGEFVAVVSINTEDSSSVQKIAAELEVAFSAVSAGGRGKYDLSTMKKLSNITVSVQYSGAMGVNPGTWASTPSPSLDSSVVGLSNVLSPFDRCEGMGHRFDVEGSSGLPGEMCKGQDPNQGSVDEVYGARSLSGAPAQMLSPILRQGKQHGFHHVR